MFPRLSLLYRLVAISVLVAGVLLFFASQITSSDRGRAFWTDDLILAGNQEARDLSRLFASVSPSPAKTNATPRAVAVVTTANVVNPHDFNYVINPAQLCSMDGLFMVIYIHSAPNNYKKRQMIRQTWGAKKILTRYKLRIVFVMGSVPDTKVMNGVKLESGRYGDLVVEDFLDSYRNLTYKAVASLRWLSRHCNNVTYVLKTDDDILVDIHALIAYIKSPKVQEYGTTNLLMCNQWTRMKVIRDKKSKWFISKAELESDYFSPYCSGSAFVMSSDVVRKLYHMSFSTPFFWVDDFYLTGQLVQKLDLKHRRLNEAYILNAKAALDKLKGDSKEELKFFHLHKLIHFPKMWEILTSRRNISCPDCPVSVSAATVTAASNGSGPAVR